MPGRRKTPRLDRSFSPERGCCFRTNPGIREGRILADQLMAAIFAVRPPNRAFGEIIRMWGVRASIGAHSVGEGGVEVRWSCRAGYRQAWGW